MPDYTRGWNGKHYIIQLPTFDGMSVAPSGQSRRMGQPKMLLPWGDQPQGQVGSVQVILQEYESAGASLIVPSYQMKRGHPWLVAKELWDEILAMKSPESPREFLNRHAKEIKYINVDTPGVLADLDTPEDYLKSRPF